MLIFINLLAATTGGQITRAKAFLECVQSLYPDASLIVLKNSMSLREIDGVGDYIILNINLGSKFKAVKRMIWENIFLIRQIKRYSPNLYLTFSHYLPIQKFKIPTLVGVSNLAPFSKNAIAIESYVVKVKLWLLRRSIISSVNKATSVLALSETCKEILKGEGVSTTKIFVASNGVDKYWAEESEKVDLKKHGIWQPFMLYVSNFHRYKNHKVLIEAYRLIPEEMRKKYQLVFIGKPDSQSYFNELFSIVNSDKSLSGRIILMPGASSNFLRFLYQKTILFLFPSLIENSPNILLEAMMAGAPSLVSKLAPMTEFYGPDGAYFDPLDPVKVSQEMVRMINDRRLCSLYREHGQKRAKEYTWVDFTQRVMNEAYRLNSECENQEL